MLPYFQSGIAQFFTCVQKYLLIVQFLPNLFLTFPAGYNNILKYMLQLLQLCLARAAILLFLSTLLIRKGKICKEVSISLSLNLHVNLSNLSNEQ